MIFPIIELNIFPITLFIKNWLFQLQLIFHVLLSYFIYYNFFNFSLSTPQTKPELTNDNDFRLLLGTDSAGKNITIPRISMYQNILVTGSIGSGKTSSCIYSILAQLLTQSAISGLILDVKGNMKDTILHMLDGDISNLIVVEVSSKCRYNPLHTPNLKPYIISNRLISVLSTFSNKNTTDTYWFDKAESLLTELIKLIRLYNNSYLTFIEIYKLISSDNYIKDKITLVKKDFLANKLSKSQIIDFDSIVTYFANEYSALDSKIITIIKSEITRLTYPFIADSEISEVFCSSIDQLTFHGCENIFYNNQIILLQMNISKFRNVSKIIAAYLKLDFQSAVFQKTSSTSTFFVCDEYHEYVTENDASFFSLSREYNCINIVSTQSYSSILNSLNNETAVSVILQNFVNKIFLRTDDIFTIEYAQKIFGKDEKYKESKTFSEAGNETTYNFLLNIMRSKKSNISETLSNYTNFEYIIDTRDLSQNLKSFEAYAHISDGTSIISPIKINLIPYFRKEN